MKSEFWLILILFIFVIGYIFIANNKINRLQDELLKEKQRNSYVIDSLEIEAKHKEDSVYNLECSIYRQDKIIDSLYREKINTKLIYPVVTSSTSESVNQLKEILCAID